MGMKAIFGLLGFLSVYFYLSNENRNEFIKKKKTEHKQVGSRGIEMTEHKRQ